MNITSFNPLIVTGNAQAAIALFEAMGFERRHGITVTSNGKDISVDTRTNRSAMMIAPSGFAFDLCQHIKDDE